MTGTRAVQFFLLHCACPLPTSCMIRGLGMKVRLHRSFPISAAAKPRNTKSTTDVPPDPGGSRRLDWQRAAGAHRNFTKLQDATPVGLAGRCRHVWLVDLFCQFSMPGVRLWVPFLRWSPVVRGRPQPCLDFGIWAGKGKGACSA